MSFLAVGVTAGAGLVEAGIGALKAHKAQQGLQNLRTPSYQPNQAVSSYYQQALQRANTSPYASDFYQQAQKTAGRNLATGIGALQDRRSATGNIGALVQGSNDSLNRAGVQAEGLQRQAFGQLGSAVGMQQGDYQKQFQYNQEAPYEKQAGIYQAKAIAGSQMENTGLSSAFGGLGSASQFGMLKQLYGTPGQTTGAAQPATSTGGGQAANAYNPGVGGFGGTFQNQF
jgi:hypothetical protein